MISHGPFINTTSPDRCRKTRKTLLKLGAMLSSGQIKPTHAHRGKKSKRKIRTGYTRIYMMARRSELCKRD